MRLLNTLLQRRAKKYAKGLCVAMITSLNNIKSAHPDLDGMQIFKMAIETRPEWHQKQNGEFQYKNLGSFAVSPEMGLRTIMSKMAYCELPDYLDDLEASEQMPLIDVAIDAIENY